MINAIIKGIISFLITIINIILLPIDTAISTLLPDLNNAISAINGFLSLCCTSIGWVVSLFGLSAECLSLIVAYFTFKLTAPLLFYSIKTAVKWFDKIKL